MRDRTVMAVKFAILINYYILSRTIVWRHHCNSMH